MTVFCRRLNPVRSKWSELTKEQHSHSDSNFIGLMKSTIHTDASIGVTALLLEERSSMHGLFAGCGIISFAFLYFGGFALSVTTFQKAARWFDERRLCTTWPKHSTDIAVKTLDTKMVPCELPELFRRREQTSESSFTAKLILTDAYKKCIEGHACND